ncbi:hypothetical protein ABL78_4183 [Leptomonas seymouri]|uniref:Transmembrane protein n=1 Tax=Leptomonas seymouri TaxID=5684 RepID=A0A0N0P5R2_LEPSE|nr:hypothetical protein ABL78_4183 [Leptomonas seymouri]|eukprot:KPI86766.1 hypothetical protein ABL78_4183 [Leptomonas seymouri]
MMAPMIRATCLVLVVLFCSMVHVVLTAETRNAIPHASVSIVSGTLAGAKGFANRRQHGGEWQFDFGKAAEEAFFGAENKAARQWRDWRNKLRSLRAYRQQQKDANTGNEDAEAAKNGTAGGNSPRGTDGKGFLWANYFTEHRVEKRIQDRIKKQASLNTSTAEGSKNAWAEVRKEIAALWDRVKSAGASETPTDQAYVDLVERHFPHTHRQRAMLEASHFSDSLALLRTPFLLEAEALPHVSKEVQHLRELWLRLRNAVTSEAAAPAIEEVDTQLSAMNDFVEGSLVSYTQIISLADPLAEAADHWVASTLVTTVDAIRTNDESTEAKRIELKQLHKLRSSLQKAKQALDRHTSVYRTFLRRNQLPNAEAIIFALELLAKQRLGNEVPGVLDVLPMLSTTAPLTGLLEEEWKKHVLLPAFMCVLITAGVMWVTGEVKEWCLRRVQASKMCTVAGVCYPLGLATAGTGRMRKLFLLACLLQVLAPPLLPALVLSAHLFNAADWSMAAVKLMRPSQRMLCAGACLALTVLNYAWGVAVRRLFLLIDPSVHRRRYAKTK